MKFQFKKKLSLLFAVMALLVGTPASYSQESNRYESLKGSQGTVVSEGGDVVITRAANIRGFGKDADPDINSPKSATFSKDGSKFYINSLEGCKTVVYDAKTRQKLKVIEHKFDSGKGNLWLPMSGFYQFTHYPDGIEKAFGGKPVEAALSKDGRYLFVPYYRRTFDLNAQDPSALAVIDTQKDEIVLMTETGPLPKMVKVSNDGRLLAITHWGDNTVGFLDISDSNPRNWKHLPPVEVGKKLNLNYSLTSPVNRDSGSGYLLRGTVFLPGDSLLLVSGMAGPLAVIDVKKREWIGMVPAMGNVRHITIKGDMLYLSRNSAGEVLTVPVKNVVDAVSSQRATSREFKINGVKRARVGGGARTLKVSPGGNYIFVASNTAKEIGIVRTSDMKKIVSIPADPFPVGLDISPDGLTVISTSQGRKGNGGGNAVNIFDLAYAVPEKAVAEPEDEAVVQPAADTLSAQEQWVKEQKADRFWWIIGMVIGIVLFLALAFYAWRRKKRE